MLKVVKSGACMAMVIAISLVVGATVFNTAHAEDPHQDAGVGYTVNVAPSLKVTLSSNNVVLNLNPNTHTSDSGDLDISVSTNNASGYKLSMSSVGDATDLSRNSTADGKTASIPTLSAAAGTTPASLTDNTWGYRLSETDNFIPYVSGVQIMDSFRPTNNDEATVSFASKINYSQAAGSYSLGLALTAVVNPPIVYLQDVDTTTCTTDPTIAVDKRDNQEYVIQRLADGKCWMMTNLNLGAIDLTQDLTSENTNCATSGSTACVATNMSGTPSLTAANFNSYEKTSGSGTYTAPEYIPVSGNDTTMGTPGVPYGTLYNYCAASAGTICTDSNGYNASYDLCPAGWRLPTGGSFGEFQTLYNQSAYNSNANMRKSYENGGAAFALAGDFYTSVPTGQGSNGFYWSSTRYNTTSMYRLNFDTSNVYPAISTYRYNGFSIRCVLKDNRTLSDIANMQDINPEIVANTATGTSNTLKDVRDNEEYLVKKLNDGNIWLLENLRLDPTAVTLDKLKGDTQATDEVLTYFKNGGGSSPYPATGVRSTNYFSSDGYTLPYIDATYKDTVVEASATAPAGKVGVYYNFCAASAGSNCRPSDSGVVGNAPYSICPAGWHMPNGGTYTTGYYYLYNTGYSANASNFLTALSATPSGYSLSGSVSYQGERVYLWGSTSGNTYNSQSLVSYSSYVYPQQRMDRVYGIPVRCVTY